MLRVSVSVLLLLGAISALAQDVYYMESNCSMIEKIPPKGVSFSDLICIFAMSY